MIKSIAFSIIFFLSYSSSASNDIKIERYIIHTDFTKDSNYADVTVEIFVEKDSALTDFSLLLNHDVKIKSIDGHYYTPFSPWSVKIDHKFTGGDTMLISLPQNFKNNSEVYLKFGYSYPVNIYKDSINILEEIYKEFAGKVMSLDDFINVLKKNDPNSKTIGIFNHLITNIGTPD